MSVSSPFIFRPIATSLLGVAVMLGGILGYVLLPVASLPQVDFPTIQVTTQLPGANAETIASLVTAPLERQFGQIPALANMTSSSSYGVSQITLQFELSREIDAAAQDVQSAINAAGATLPRNLPYPPVYSKVNPADAPVLTLALTSPTISLRQMSDLADTLIAQRLSEVSGVGHVSVQGGLKPAIRIQADLARLASYGIALEDLRTAIIAANVAGPKGALDGAQQSYTIASNDQVTGIETYRSLIIAYRGGAPVMLNDVADVIDSLENSKVGGWYQNEPAVIIDIQRQPGANVIDTVRRVGQELPRLQRVMPKGVSLAVVQDRTGTIRASVQDVQFTLILSVALVVLVVFIFLRTLRATIIAGVALPLSLVATFGVMWFCGFSLDNLSLMALTVGTGFVIDDAIVMIENIVRHMEQGEPAFEAALTGAREIGFTIISLTVSLVAVFIPLLFMSGIVGRMFREFALTLTVAVITSAAVSLTLTPMMCSRLLRRIPGTAGVSPTSSAEERAERPRSHGQLNWAIETAVEGYRASLQWVLHHESATLVMTVLTLMVTIWLYIIVPKGFLPIQDTGLIKAVTEAGPEVSYGEMQRLQKNVVEVIRRDADVTGVISVVGVTPMNPTPNAGRLAITLKPRDQRPAFVTDIIERLKRAVASVPGMTVYFQPVQDIQISTRASRALFQYTLASTDAAEVSRWADALVTRLRQDALFRDVASEAQNGGLRADIRVDRDKAGRLGISMQAISDTLNDAFGQRQISTIFGQANQYRVILEAMPEYQRDPGTLSKLYLPAGTTTIQNTLSSSTANLQLLPTNATNLVPLSAVATVMRTTAALAIQHQNQFPAVTVSFNLTPEASLGDAVAALSTAENDVGMPASVAGTYAGDIGEFASSLAGEPWLIVAAVVTIYIVLGMLYESFVHPLTILSTLPSAGVGALAALMMFGQDLSIIALIGIVLLMGIVKKNAIMMIDFALEAERTGGLPPAEAILQASLLRFRPIMMTTLAALFGALPLALETGTGSELRFPLGITIIGGLLLSQVLTLYTTPVVYLALDRLHRRLSGPRLRPGADQAPPLGA
jgi:multidrug efflux pump